jgi:hypothetical protein
VVYLYSLVLMLSAGLFGTFCRSVMLGLGFVPDLASGLYILATSGSIYLAMQCVYMGGLRILAPTTARSTYFSEMASGCATLILLPYVLHVSVPWPLETLERLEPLLYLCGFGVIHLFLKLSTFYASLQGAPSGRRGVIGYAASTILFILLGVFFQSRWVDSLEAARTQAPNAVEDFLVGSLHAEGRLMPEGATLRVMSAYRRDQTISTRWASTADSEVARVYATFVMQGDEEKVYQSWTKPTAGAWSEIRVPNEFVPDGLWSYEVRWTRQKEPNWQRILGLRPIVYNLPETPGAEPPPPSIVLMSGPFVHAERPIAREPNIVLILVDGLAANHLSMMGYEREVTPSLDKLGYGGLSFPNMFSPSADVGDAVAVLFTGETGGGAVSESLVSRLADAGYSTIGFTEGETRGGSDLVYGEGSESGFELFDASYDASGGSGGTLQKARKWIEGHQAIKFFMLVRLRSLEDISALTEIDGAYPVQGRVQAIDAFDNGLQRLDSQIGSLLKYIRDHETRKNTFVIVTSTYGHAFSIRSDGRRLDEATLRTPLIVNGPGIRKTKDSRRVDMDDVAATIVELARVKAPGSGRGKSVL